MHGWQCVVDAQLGNRLDRLFPYCDQFPALRVNTHTARASAFLVYLEIWALLTTGIRSGFC